MTTIRPQKRTWESPRAYTGQLPTTGKGVGVVVMDEGFDLTHPDLKDRVLGVKTNTEDSFESDSLGHGLSLIHISEPTRPY